MALAIRIYRLVEGCRTGCVTRGELRQERWRLMALAWLKRRGGRVAMVKWLAWELGQVMLAWLRGEGDLPGLLAAWYDVASGLTSPRDEVYLAWFAWPLPGGD